MFNNSVDALHSLSIMREWRSSAWRRSTPGLVFLREFDCRANVGLGEEGGDVGVFNMVKRVTTYEGAQVFVTINYCIIEIGFGRGKIFEAIEDIFAIIWLGEWDVERSEDIGCDAKFTLFNFLLGGLIFA